MKKKVLSLSWTLDFQNSFKNRNWNRNLLEQKLWSDQKKYQMAETVAKGEIFML